MRRRLFGRGHPASHGAGVLLACVLLVLVGTVAYGDGAKRLRLPNGLRVVMKPSMSTDVVAVDLLLDISAADEPADQQGLRNLVQRLLLRGTKAESGDALARRLADVGGVAEATLGLDYVEVYALAPTQGFEVALDIIAEAVQNPAFDPDEVQKQIEGAQQASVDARNDPFQETYLAFRERMYGDHPYAELTLGSPSSLARIGYDDVVGFHEANYVPNRAVIAICGGVGEARAMAAVRRAFGDWAPGLPTPDRQWPPVTLTASDLTARERPVRQAHLIFGFPAPAAGEDGYYAVQVIDSILGGGTTGMVMEKLRDEMGLVYTASSFYPTLAGESHFAIYAVTDPSQLESVKTAVLGLVDAMRDSPVSETELSRAKSYLLGSYALSHQRMKDQAYSLAWYEILGLGVDFEPRYVEAIKSVTAEQVQEAAQRLFPHFVLAVTLPEE